MSRKSVCLAVLVSSSPALAAEAVYQLRSEEDLKAVADPVTECKVAPFEVNVRLPASLFVPEPQAKDGKVKSAGKKKVGTGLACVRITDRTFPEGSQADMYARCELPEGRFTAVGKCTVVSNAVPRPGIVLAGCALKLTEFPAAYAGGLATSTSVFNPTGLPGFNTGSLWTLRAFTPEKAPAQEKDAEKQPGK
jgi:hypothetical protein